MYIVSPVRRDDSDDRCQEAVARREVYGDMGAAPYDSHESEELVMLVG